MARNVKINDSTFFTPGGPNPGPGRGTGNSPAQACKQLRADLGADAFRAAFGTNHNGRNAFGKCVSKMARMQSDEARAAAVTRIGHLTDRCHERTTTGHGKGNAKGKDTSRRHRGGFVNCLRDAV